MELQHSIHFFFKFVQLHVIKANFSLVASTSIIIKSKCNGSYMLVLNADLLRDGMATHEIECVRVQVTKSNCYKLLLLYV